ncbi:hypothetical protein F4805DRAFT_410405 [Annulohypoxylon moriforme]|nr:hypothetical protein F4805DRAFT_410405 [Annulohypoxylon moriforme]
MLICMYMFFLSLLHRSPPCPVQPVMYELTICYLLQYIHGIHTTSDFDHVTSPSPHDVGHIMDLFGALYPPLPPVTLLDLS